MSPRTRVERQTSTPPASSGKPSSGDATTSTARKAFDDLFK